VYQESDSNIGLVGLTIGDLTVLCGCSKSHLAYKCGIRLTMYYQATSLEHVQSEESGNPAWEVCIAKPTKSLM